MTIIKYMIAGHLIIYGDEIIKYNMIFIIKT